MPTFFIRRADGDRLVAGLTDGFIGIYRAKQNRIELWRDDGVTMLCYAPGDSSARQLNDLAAAFDRDEGLARDMRLVHLGRELLRFDWSRTHGTAPAFLDEIEQQTHAIADSIRERCRPTA